jgi:hypothetical protein
MRNQVEGSEAGVAIVTAVMPWIRARLYTLRKTHVLYQGRDHRNVNLDKWGGKAF